MERRRRKIKGEMGGGLCCGGEAEVEGAGSVCCCLGEVESQGRETEVEGAGPMLMRGRSTLWVVLVWGRKEKMKTVRGLFGFGGKGRGFLWLRVQALDLLVEGEEDGGEKW